MVHIIVPLVNTFIIFCSMVRAKMKGAACGLYIVVTTSHDIASLGSVRYTTIAWCHAGSLGGRGKESLIMTACTCTNPY